MSAEQTTYTPRPFDKSTQLTNMYGINPSKRQLKKFNKYWDSAKRKDDQEAFEKAEFRRFKNNENRKKLEALKRAKEEKRTALIQKNQKERQEKEHQRKIDLGYIYDPVTKTYTKTEEVVETPAAVVNTQLVTGQFENNKDWHNYMSSKYQKVRMPDGTSAYKDPKTGMYYYNDGQSYDPLTRRKLPYTWQPLKPSNGQPSSEKSYLNGKDSYKTGIIMQKDFDSLFNKYLGGKYYYKSESHLPEDKRTVNFTLIRQDPLYKQAWEEFQNLYDSDNGWLYNSYTRKKKNGGIINKHQQGGTMNQQELQQQVVQLVQAAMQGDQKAGQQIEQIMQAAKKGDKQAAQIAQMIQAVAQQMQGKSTKAALGAKLNYIQKLKGNCPEGTEKVYLKNGGCMCQQKKQSGGALPNENSAPDKLKKKLKPQTPLKPVKPVDPINKVACGGKTKKN